MINSTNQYIRALFANLFFFFSQVADEIIIELQAVSEAFPGNQST
jgi:hypothetical protein